MFRLKLVLPFGVTLVHKREFWNQRDANTLAMELPIGFEVVEDNDPDLKDAIIIPIKEEAQK